MILNRNKEVNISFGKQLREVRESKNLSQESLANKAEISISQVSRLERGLLNPTLSTIIQLSSALNVPVDELLSFLKN
jgi:transcriptional regulator with XRE-family HTH domain